jgi:hypothetical protein
VIDFRTMKRGELVCVLVLAAGCFGATLAAQERRWEVDLYGGAAARAASAGKQTLPSAGPAIVTSNPLFPSREVPSWLFGDGTSLVNAVNEEFGGSARVTPLDALFARVSGGTSAVAGARVRRGMSPRTSFEISVDVLGRARVAPSDLAAAIESTRQSFADIFSELLRSGPFTSVVVDAAADVASGARREIAATAALNTDLRSFGSLMPYLTIGGGIITATGPQPGATLTGRYRFSILGQVPIDESDRVTVRFERPIALAAVVGAGLRHELSERWALRVDLRAFVGPDSTRVRITAEPANQPATPAGFVESFTNPSIQFSNDPALGRRSSLGAPGLDRVVVFSGGVQARTVVTVGVSRRF